MPKGERLQKVLARAGLASRREIERWLQAGRIRVNGALARLGDRVTPKDRISVDGRPLQRRWFSQPARRVLVYHKPEGEVVTRVDPQERPTVFSRLPRLAHGRWIAIGRLDINSAGLLLLTTDGELAQRLMHPSHAVDREYAVRVLGQVTDTTTARLLKGVQLEDGLARFHKLVDAGGQGANHWYHVVLREGRKREVRRLWESQGLRVSRLIRIRFGPIALPRSLRTGQWKELQQGDISLLLKVAGIKEDGELVAVSERSAPARRR